MKDPRIPASPWGLFLVLVVSNTLLSYGSLSLQAKLWVGLFGVFLPLVLVLSDRNASWGRVLEPPEIEPFVPLAWAWIAVGVLALGMRFIHLTTLSSWPLLDESVMGYLGVEIARGVPVPWFFELNLMPMLYHHGMASLFRTFGPSLTTLWVYPALFSAGSVFLVWRASRSIFDRTFAFLLTALWAGSFPLSYVGRFCLPHSAVVFSMALTFYLWAKWRRSNGWRSTAWAAALGIVAGAGFHLYLTWAVVAVLVVVAFHAGSDARKRPFRTAASFWVPLVVLAAPVVFYAAANPPPYVKGLFSTAGFGSVERWKVTVSYITALFWGVDTPLFAYKPLWGGYLNPVAASCFFLGVLRSWTGSARGASASAAALLLLLAPGLVSNHEEYFRVVQVFPLLVLFAARGLQVLVGRRSPHVLLAGVLILAASTALDLHHLMGRYGSFWPRNEARWYAYMKSPENRRAYGLIREKARRDGPGVLFTDFLQEPIDRSLWFATMSYNALEGNRRRTGTAPGWAALVVNVHLAPFLEERFPGATWVWLSEGMNIDNGGLALVFLPMSGPVPVPLEGWVRAHRTFSAVAAKTIHSTYIGASDAPARGILEKDRASFEGDRFLESVYWNRMMLSWAVDGRLPEVSKAVSNAIELGYKAAIFYNEQGCLRTLQGDVEGARRAFRRALACPFDRTPAARNLERLK